MQSLAFFSPAAGGAKHIRFFQQAVITAARADRFILIKFQETHLVVGEDISISAICAAT